jgi:hypothetical protein
MAGNEEEYADDCDNAEEERTSPNSASPIAPVGFFAGR